MLKELVLEQLEVFFEERQTKIDTIRQLWGKENSYKIPKYLDGQDFNQIVHIWKSLCIFFFKCCADDIALSYLWKSCRLSLQTQKQK